MLDNPILGPAISGLSGADFFGGLIRALINVGLIVGVVVFFFIFLLGAIQWISSGGDKGATESARNKLTNAVVGLVILFALFALAGLIEAVFGIDILFLDLGALQIAGSSVALPNPGPGSGSVGIASCSCSAALGGGCASSGTIAVGPASECFRCTVSGWDGPIGGFCGSINCGTCP